MGPEIANRHGAFFATLETLSNVEKDDLLKRQALANIADHPLKFARNWVANLGRIFFNYPFSYTLQKISTYVYILPNMSIVTLVAICLYPVLKNWRIIPAELYALLVFGVLGFAASSVLSAVSRMLVPLVPIFGLCIVVILGRAFSLNAPTPKF